MKIDVEWDFTDWALLLRAYWSRHFLTVHILCCYVTFWAKAVLDAFPEEAPEEELRQLNEYAEGQMKFISEERERIHKRMGIKTT